MNGIYIGVEKAGLFDTLEQHEFDFQKTIRVIDFPVWASHTGFLVKKDTEVDIIIDKEKELFACISGIIIYEDKFQDFQKFINDFLKIGYGALDRIKGGSYFIYISQGSDFYLITDLFGQNPHYINKNKSELLIAPSPNFLKEDMSVNPMYLDFFKKNNYLYGNYTVYEGIERLDPSCIYKNGERFRYYKPKLSNFKEKLVSDQLHQAVSLLPKEHRFLPISGGLDSRLILASVGEIKYGFTYGPKDYGDRFFAKPFGKYFENYIATSLLDIPFEETDFRSTQLFADGTALIPWTSLGVYRFLSSIIPKESIVIDGFAGDALTHNHYFYTNNFFHRLFPSILKYYSIEEVIKMRYRNCSENQFNHLLKTYKKLMNDFPKMDEPHKLWYFELLYGRGTKYIYLNTVTINQYFRTFQPFLYKDVFENLFSQDPFKAMQYQNIRNIWRNVGYEFSERKTDSGFRPLDNGQLIIFKKYLNKLITKTKEKIGFKSKYSDYVNEVHVLDKKLSTNLSRQKYLEDLEINCPS